VRHNPTVACAWVGRGVVVIIVESGERRSRDVESIGGQCQGDQGLCQGARVEWIRGEGSVWGREWRRGKGR
jgi:hypothetical protein